MLQNRAGDALIPEVGLAKNKTQKGQTVSTGACYQFGRFRLHVAENGNMSLRTHGQAIGLTTGELTILRVLLENRGQFVKTRTLLNRVTQSPRASENIVHGAVRQLRRTLNDVDLIKTERSKGYCFTGNVTMTADDAAVVTGSRSAVDQVAAIAAEFSGSGYQIETANRRRHSFLVVSLLAGTAVLLLPFGLAFAAGSWKSVTREIGFIQALMILVAIGYDYFLANDPRPKDTDKETRRAQIAVQQFRRSWRLLLASWCGLYVTLLLSQGLSWSADSAASHWQTLQVITTFLNNSSALMLVMCYLVLNRPTVVHVAGREVENVPLARGLILVAGFGLLEAALVVYLEKFGHAAYTAVVLFGADLLSGIVGGIAMALFISRLDSRLLGASRLLPIIPIVLYFYVVIQPFYPLLNWTYPLGSQVPEHFDLWIMQLAFVLKSIMYIYVTELLKSERLLFYMISARRVYENAATEWRNFTLTGAKVAQE
jgi:DNA-binding winged helix-turn-helix (wHTH) protein